MRTPDGLPVPVDIADADAHGVAEFAVDEFLEVKGQLDHRLRGQLRILTGYIDQSDELIRSDQRASDA